MYVCVCVCVYRNVIFLYFLHIYMKFLSFPSFCCTAYSEFFLNDCIHRCCLPIRRSWCLSPTLKDSHLFSSVGGEGADIYISSELFMWLCVGGLQLAHPAHFSPTKEHSREYDVSVIRCRDSDMSLHLCECPRDVFTKSWEWRTVSFGMTSCTSHYNSTSISQYYSCAWPNKTWTQ